jgi:hypothetical protein
MSHRSFYSSFVTTNSGNINIKYDKNLKHALSASFWCNQIPKTKKCFYTENTLKDKFDEIITQPQTEQLHELTTSNNENEYQSSLLNILYHYIKYINNEWEKRMKDVILKANQIQHMYDVKIDLLLKENYDIKYKFKKMIEDIKRFHLERVETEVKQKKIIMQVIKENEYLRKCIYNTNNIYSGSNNNNNNEVNNFEEQLSYRKSDINSSIQRKNELSSNNNNRSDTNKDVISKLDFSFCFNENNGRNSIKHINNSSSGTNIIQFSK